MKPAPFKYFVPETIEEAGKLLHEHGYDAKLLAGGQSLIPTMNFRLSQPAVLIDLNGIKNLSYLKEDKNSGGIQIGAMARHRDLERSHVVGNTAPLLFETMPFIAHTQIRNRGTVGGSVAHADPAAELPAVMSVLNARFQLQGPNGKRWVPAEEFFVGLFATALEPDEILTEIIIPKSAPNTGWAFEEVARRKGDYALVGVACTVTLDENKICKQARIGFLSVGEGPVLAQEATQLLQGKTLSKKIIQSAAETAAAKDIDPPGDIHASSEFRRHLAKVLTERALTKAFARTNLS